MRHDTRRTPEQQGGPTRATALEAAREALANAIETAMRNGWYGAVKFEVIFEGGRPTASWCDSRQTFK